MTSNATSVLFDVNVWLALSYTRHLHHPDITAIMPEMPTPVFCRFTQHALLRHLSNPQVMGPGVHTPPNAWKEYDRIFAGTGASLLAEPDNLVAQWRKYADEGQGHSGSAWSDSYLAAFAVCSGIKLVTFDRGFRRFKGLDSRIL